MVLVCNTLSLSVPVMSLDTQRKSELPYPITTRDLQMKQSANFEVDAPRLINFKIRSECRAPLYAKLVGATLS